MRRIDVLQVLNLDGEDHDEWIKKLADGMGWVTNAQEAIQALGQVESDAVIIDGFSIKEAELIALEIRMQFEDVYIGIISEGVRHRERNAYANEVIPRSFAALKEALGHAFIEAT